MPEQLALPPQDLTAAITSASGPQELGLALKAMPGLLRAGIETGCKVAELGRLASQVTDLILSRALELALLELGPAPAGFSLLALGSEGRLEQYLATDQDNALILASDASELAPYFESLAQRVSGVLIDSGYPACPHQVMAANPKWRGSLGDFKRWITLMLLTPDEEAVLNLSLLADARSVSGQASLADELKSYYCRKLREHPLALRYLAREAVSFAPPIKFFGGLATEKTGPHQGQVDLKKGGIFPVVQGVKALALESGLAEASTLDRLRVLGLRGNLEPEFAQGLGEAYELILRLRLLAQLEAEAQGRTPGSHIRPDRLGRQELDELKRALRLVAAFQELIAKHFELRLLT